MEDGRMVKKKMKRAKTVIFMGPEEVHQHTFEHLLKDGFYNDSSTFVLVHILNEKSKAQFPPSIDIKNEQEVEDYIYQQFSKFEEEFIDSDRRPKIEKEIILNSDTKLSAINFLKDSGADSCVVASSGEDDLGGAASHSSAFYLVAHAPCDVLVIRPD